MLLNKKQATDLAKAWRLGNRFRKKSLTKKHNLASASSKNTGRVKMGIRMDIESKPREYYPALDDDGSLVFFTGNPMKRIQVSDLFVPPKATKKENTMRNHKLKILETLFPNKEDILVPFLEKYDFDINNYSILKIKEDFKAFIYQIDERTEYQLVAQKIDGSELKSSWYKDENDLSDMQQKCEDSDEYESTSVLKRIVDVDEDEDNEEEFSSILPTKYTDGEEIEAGQNFSEEDEVEENKDKAKAYEELRQLYNLTNLALRQIPGSPKQRETIKKLNKLRKSLNMKPLKEMEIDINDEINESVIEASVKDFNSTFAGSKSEFEKLKKDLAKNNMKVKIIKKYPDGQIDFFVQAKNPRFVKKIQKDIEKKYDVSLSTVPESVELEEAMDMYSVEFRGSKSDLTKLTKELDKMRIDYMEPSGKPGEYDLEISPSDKNKMKNAEKILGKKFKGKIDIYKESTEIEESKVFDKIKFKGADKKLALSVVDMIKSKAKPKEIAKSFKKLKVPSQELIMKALGDKGAQDLLQKGQLLNQLIGIFDEVDPKGLDGRSKDFRDKVRKLEYNKKKKLPYEVFEKKVVKEKKLKALQTKSDKTGIPYGILKQVFNRGVAAWRTGHRPGTNPTQWGYARVNSFATKSKGTWGGADKDLAAKARGSIKKKG
jgi:nitrogen regulatory protein PII